MTKVFVKFYNDAHEIVLVPVNATFPIPHSWKPAESYTDARKRNYRADTRSRYRRHRDSAHVLPGTYAAAR